MADGNGELIPEMIRIFIEQVDEFKDGMQNALNEKDWVMLSKIAHKAKSSVAVMGMKDIAEQLKNLEINAMEGLDTENYNKIVDIFLKACNEAVTELKEYIP